jgi:hypothetical protein
MNAAWVGVGLLVIGVAAGCAGVLGGPSPVNLPAPGPNVFEGTVKASQTARAPIGDPGDYAVAYVRVSVSSRGAQSPQWVNLRDEVRGSPQVTIETEDGPRQVTLGDPMTTWFGFGGGDEARLDTLASIPEFAALPGQDVPNRLGFVVTVRGVREGERLLVEVGPDGRTATRIWRGGRDGFTRTATGGSANAQLVQRTMIGVSAGGCVGGIAALLWHWLA